MRVSYTPVRLAALCAAVIAPLALGACDTMQDAFGIGKLPPDEYAVAPRRPLAMPPDINLRPPQPGAGSPADISASGIAASAMGNAGSGATAAPTAPVEAAPVPPPSAPPTESETTSTTTDGEGRVLTTGR